MADTDPAASIEDSDVYIVVDMEGISGVTDGRMIRTGHSQWESRGRQLMTADVNAAIEGAREAGANRIYVKDGHDSGENVLSEELHESAELISGSTAWKNFMPALDDTFDVVLLLGFHARIGTTEAHFDHTVSTACVSEIRLNETPVGEIGIYGAVAGREGVPIGAVTGDAAAVDEAVDLFGDIETATVKQGHGRTVARVRSPERTRPEIREAARRAVEGDGTVWSLDTPLCAEVDFFRSAEADMAEIVPGAERTGGRTVQYRHDDPEMVFDALQAILNLGNVAASQWARALYTTGAPK
jgi:D-amino peptidase